MLIVICSLSLMGNNLEIGMAEFEKGNYQKAFEFYKKSCTEGTPLGCFHLGTLFENGIGVEQDDAKASTSYKKACESACLSACSNLGVFYSMGRGGVKQDDFNAFILFEKSCNGGIPYGIKVGSAIGCFNLGVAYHKGKGVKQDDFKAIALYKIACDSGSANGCFGLGVMYLYGEGIKQDNNIALTYFGKSCDMKNQKGCEAYADIKKITEEKK